MKVKKINLNSNRLPYRSHIKKLMLWRKNSKSVYFVVMASLIKELEVILKQEKLTKSSGWSGPSNIIKIDLGGKISDVIDKYLKTLKWILIGKEAGPDSVKMAKLLGVYDKASPGILISAYLDSLDADREYYSGIHLDNPDKIDKNLLSDSIENIVNHTNRMTEQMIPEIKNSIIYAIENIQESLNYKNLAIAQGIDPDSKYDAKLNPYAAKYALKKELRDAAIKSGKKWDLRSSIELGKASAVGSHQALIEVFGGDSNDAIKVIWKVMESENNCKFCYNASKNPDGTFKFYSMKDFRPSGYNYNKKQADWELTIPPIHPNCYCRLIYVPKGFTVTNDGEIIPESK